MYWTVGLYKSCLTKLRFFNFPVVPSTISNSTMPRPRYFTVRLRHCGLNSYPGNFLTCRHTWAWLPNRQDVLSSLNIIFSHHLPAWAGLPPCPLDYLAPLNIGHQLLPACLATNRQQSHFSPPLMQKFRRFELAVGQRHAEVCSSLARFRFIVLPNV